MVGGGSITHGQGAGRAGGGAERGAVGGGVDAEEDGGPQGEPPRGWRGPRERCGRRLGGRSEGGRREGGGGARSPNVVGPGSDKQAQLPTSGGRGQVQVNNRRGPTARGGANDMGGGGNRKIGAREPCSVAMTL